MNWQQTINCLLLYLAHARIQELTRQLSYTVDQPTQQELTMLLDNIQKARNHLIELAATTRTKRGQTS